MPSSRAVDVKSKGGYSFRIQYTYENTRHWYRSTIDWNARKGFFLVKRTVKNERNQRTACAINRP